MTEREQADELTLEAEVDLIHTQLLHDLGHHELAIRAAELMGVRQDRAPWRS